MAARKQTKVRARLVETDTEIALRRRGAELVGLVLIGLAALATAIIWTYSPDDPSLFSATDAAPRNALGLIGASIADPLHRALGWAAYGLPVALAVWGLRLVLHSGDTRIVTRTIFTPIAMLVAAAFAATHVPLASWTHDYGLGGLLGDAALGAILGALPFAMAVSLPFVALGLGLLFLAASGFVLGVTWAEFTAFLRMLRDGSVLLYAALLRLTGRAVSTAAAGAAGGARVAREKAAEARARRADAAQASRVATPPLSRAAGIPPFDPTALGGASEPPAPPPLRAEPAPRAESRAAPRRGRRAAEPAMAEEIDLLDPEDEAVPPLAARMVPEAPEAKPAAPRTGKSRARARAPEPGADFLPEAESDPEAEYQAPPVTLLQNPATIIRQHLSTDQLEENARMLESVLDDYGVRGEITSIRPGPVVTMYELEPAAGLKASRVIGLSEDIARSMSALACRVSTIPGRSVIGIELPNDFREKVLLREILAAKGFSDSAHALPLALGKDIGGEPVVANLARMPHLLIAGTTGSGKSVAINTMILSLLYKLAPRDCRLIMIDPKMLELSVYDGIPHLLSPVVTDPKKAVVALKWTVAEMEERYRKMSKMGVRNIDGYNQRVKDALERGEGFTRTVQTGFDEETGEPMFETEEYAPETMPYIVVIVDEMADLMMVAGKEIEACIQRLAQMARASGIHLIMATQRPSVDVITGTIKANFPTRISFQVTSKIDSRTILGEMGAEQLLGQGDMLYMAGGGRITRVHGPFVSDEEVEDVVTHLKSLGSPDYDAGVIEGPDSDEQQELDLVLGLGGNTGGDDALYDQAVAIVAKDRKCSTSYIQRKLSVGYNKAAKLVEMMEDQGVVSQANHVGKREVLVPER
ncbi:DNA translocase FtsK [Amaricoccus solimangrovi]|uniref:DNA translocase FtsK n=1 Tax=Amaricoccus solimangrovi TaxID=2589815 RepID=A0A501WXE2_9RHOB|nr:DNA translocase FtsK [Amaricoccus solimangrovi]TPE53120.1 DNA translocase FtsK [Amaricoccus solimangrovi]